MSRNCKQCQPEQSKRIIIVGNCAHKVASQIYTNDNPWSRERRLPCSFLGQTDLHQSNRNEGQQEGHRVGRQADDEIESVTGGRSADEKHSHAEMCRESKNRSFERFICHDDVGERHDSIFGEFLNDAS